MPLLSRRNLIAAALYTAGLLVLVFGFIMPDRLPLPPCWNLVPEEGQKRIALQAGDTLTTTYLAPRDNPSSIHFPSTLKDPSAPVEVSLRNQTTDTTIGHTILWPWIPEKTMPVVGPVKKGDQLALQIRQLDQNPPLCLVGKTTPDTHPTSAQTHILPILSVRYDGETADRPFAGPIDEEKHYLPIPQAAPLTFKFKAQKPDLDQLRYSVKMPEDGSDLQLQILNLTKGTTIFAQRITPEKKSTVRLKFDGANAQGDLLAISIEQIPDTATATPPPILPFLHQSTDTPIDRYHPSTTTLNGQPGDQQPLFLPRYTQPSRHLLWLWAPAAALLLTYLLRGCSPRTYLIVLGLAAFATSALSWQQLYSWFTPNYDPDGYGAQAQRIAQWIQEPAQREAIQDTMHRYTHGHIALVPAILTIPILAGIPMEAAYLTLNGLLSFASLGLLAYLLRRQLGLSTKATIIGLTLFACHRMTLPVVGAPTTDDLGLLLTLLTLMLFLRRLKAADPWHLWGLPLLALLHVLARPSGLVVWPLIAGAVCLCDIARLGRLDFPRHLRTVALVFFPPAILLAALYFGFGWFENFGRALLKNSRDPNNHDLASFLKCLLVLTQLPLLYCFFLKPRALPKFAPYVLAGWAAFFIALLVAVQATFIYRLFLPVLPAVIAFAAAGAGAMLARGKGHATLAYAILALHCAGNLAAVLYTSAPPSQLAEILP